MLDEKKAHELARKCFEHGMFVEGTWRLSGYFAFESPVSVGNAVSFCDSSIAAFSYARPLSSFHDADVGRYCSIATGAMIGVDQHPTDGLSTSAMFYDDSHFSRHSTFLPPDVAPIRKRTTIGNDVWIGTDALVLPGVTIADGAVVGAKAVVTRDVAPYSVVAGVPARHLRFRFDQSVVARLLAMRWWQYDIRLWLGALRDTNTTPLTEDFLSKIENAISSGQLSTTMPQRFMLMPKGNTFDIISI